MSKADGESWAPYDPTSRGLLAGEGAVALILERASDVAASGREPIAQLSSFAQTNDAPQVQPSNADCQWLQADPSGRWLAQAIRQSIERAECSANDIGMFIGNGCGLPAYDERELSALRSVFGEALPLESVNRHVGVLESACGMLAIAAAASHVQQHTAAGSRTAEANGNTLAEPPAVLVCTTSESGRNTCAIVKSAI